MNSPALDVRPKTSPFDRIAIAVCLVIALGLRLAVILNQPQQLTLDRDAYLGIATSVAEGRGYSSPNSTVPTAFRPPLYPLMLAIGFRVSPVAATVAGINLLTGLLTVWLTASLGNALQLGRRRYLAALLVAIDPLLLQYSSQPMTESLCTCLASLWLSCAIVKWPHGNRSRPDLGIVGFARKRGLTPFSCKAGIVSGIAFGLLVLSRPTFWLVAGFCCLAWLIARRGMAKTESPQESNLWSGIGSAGGTMIMVAPWLLRNWLVLGVPILTTTHGGYTLLLGNNPVFYDEVVRQPFGTVWPDASQKKWEAQLESQLQRDLGPQASEIERDRWQSKEAKSFILAEPRHTAEAIIHRIRSLWNTVPQGDAASGVSRTVMSAVGWFYAVELIAAAAGIVVVSIRSDRGKWWPICVLIISVQAAHLLYWTNARMRAPLTSAIALFAATAIPRRRAD